MKLSASFDIAATPTEGQKVGVEGTMGIKGAVILPDGRTALFGVGGKVKGGGTTKDGGMLLKGAFGDRGKITGTGTSGLDETFELTAEQENHETATSGMGKDALQQTSSTLPQTSSTLPNCDAHCIAASIVNSPQHRQHQAAGDGEVSEVLVDVKEGSMREDEEISEGF